MSRIVKLYTSESDNLFKKRSSSVTGSSSSKKKPKNSSPVNKLENIKSDNAAQVAENASPEDIVPESASKKPKICTEDASENSESNDVQPIESTELSNAPHQPILISIKTEMIERSENETVNENSDSNLSSADKQASLSNDTLINKTCETVALVATAHTTSSVYTRKKRILESFKANSQSPPSQVAEAVECKRKSDSSIESSKSDDAGVVTAHSNSASSLTTSKYEAFKPDVKASASFTQVVSFTLGTPLSDLTPFESCSASNALSERIMASAFKVHSSDTLPLSNSCSSLMHASNMDLSNDSASVVQVSSEKCEVNVSCLSTTAAEDKAELSAADKSERVFV